MFAPMSGLIAIVGRPNVGKSALFNRIARKRIAIVHDQAGVTRDRVMAEAEWHGRPFTIVDTGGIGLLRGEKAEDVIQAAALEQVELALEAASVILFVVNVQEGIVPLDLEVANKLRATRKPVFVVVNKCDQERASLGVGEFSALGFESIFPVSAIHGRGTDALIDAAVELLPPLPEGSVSDSPSARPTNASTEAPEGTADAGSDARFAPIDPNKPIRLAIVGRPNVGKSSLINALTGSHRVIVSPIPGTTRDAIDVPFEIDTEGVRQRYVLVDTAGVRKARKVDTSLEFFSVSRTKDAIESSDIAILVLDAETGILEQDKKIADLIVEARRACVIVINKWDLVHETVRQARQEEIQHRIEKDRSRDDRKKRLTTLSEFGEWVQERLFFLDYAPVIFTSAKEGFQLDRFLEAVRYVAAQLRQKIPTAILNRTLNDAIERRQPLSVSGRRLKFYYATQVRQAPPTFLLFVNRDDDFNDAYKRYLAGELRKAFGYEGCPLVMVPKPRPKTIESIHRSGPARSAKAHAAKAAEAAPIKTGDAKEDRYTPFVPKPRVAVPRKAGTKSPAKGSPKSNSKGPKPGARQPFRVQRGKGPMRSTFRKPRPGATGKAGGRPRR